MSLALKKRQAGQLEQAASFSAATKRVLWAVLIIAGSFGFSYVFACAAPFSALATLAALNMQRRDVLALTGLTWLVDQAVGYGLLNYPVTWSSFAWGAAIGISALLGALVAIEVARHAKRWGELAVAIASFTAAFIAYQAGLYAASFILPGGSGAFSIAIIAHVLKGNALALALLFIAYRALVAVGFVASANGSRAIPVASTG